MTFGKSVKIGILSGFGSAAGVYFFDTLVKACQKRGCIEDSDFPEVFLYNIPTKGTGPCGVADEEEMKKDLVLGVKLLNRCGADQIVIACNTVHIFYGFIQKHSKATVIHVPQCAMDACSGMKYGVMSTRSTRDSGLYGGIHATDKQQGIIERCIDHATIGKVTSKDRKEMQGIVSDMMSKGAKKVILGCTEIPLVVEKGKNIVDAGEAAINYILDTVS
jgi:aspartate racemase